MENKARLGELIRNMGNTRKEDDNPHPLDIEAFKHGADQWEEVRRAVELYRLHDDYSGIEEINRKHREYWQAEQLKKVDAINATMGKLQQPFCRMCMNRGYKAGLKGLEIVTSMCSCRIGKGKSDG